MFSAIRAILSDYDVDVMHHASRVVVVRTDSLEACAAALEHVGYRVERIGAALFVSLP